MSSNSQILRKRIIHLIILLYSLQFTIYIFQSWNKTWQLNVMTKCTVMEISKITLPFVDNSISSNIVGNKDIGLSFDN